MSFINYRIFPIFALVLSVFQLSCVVKDEDDVDLSNYVLKEEFNICPYWKDGMNWKEFLKIRNSLERPALVKYVDKIEQPGISLAQQNSSQIGL